MSTRWSILFAAPHRGMFAAGMIQGLVVMTAWALELAARHAGLAVAPPWPLPAPWLHALGMIYGVFAFFIFGFILTAGPRWIKQPDTPASVFRPAVALLAAGWLIADLGLAVPALLPLGLALAVIGWAVAVAYLWRLTALAAGDRMHIGLMAAALTVGGAGLAVFAALTFGGPGWLGPLAIALGLWGYLLPAFAVVIHRMLPFFSGSVIRNFSGRRPRWALVAILASSVGHGALSLLDAAQWTWLADLPAAVAALRLTLLWRLPESFAAHILAVLHVGFAWVGIAFALFALHSLLLLAGGAGLGLAPLHALTIGFFSSILIGMASRVTLGHSGLPIVGDGVLWGCFWAMQATALLRMSAEIWPGLNALAVLLWLTAFAVWATRYGPNFLRPRADGQPG